METYPIRYRRPRRRAANPVPRWIVGSLAAVVALFLASVAVGYHLAGRADLDVAATPSVALVKAAVVAAVAVFVASRIT
jgi:hypothetical protein